MPSAETTVRRLDEMERNEWTRHAPETRIVRRLYEMANKEQEQTEDRGKDRAGPTQIWLG